jgi:S1-C subfamily serine protease
MIRSLARGALALAICLGSALVAVALPPEVVDRGERATALVDISTSQGRAFGSAFCIDNSRGLFVTDGHVVEFSTDKIKVVVRPGEKDEHILIAGVLGIDYDADLAVIQTEKPPQTMILGLGNSDTVVPTQEVTAFGYPFGKMLSLDEKSYPSVTVNSGKITALRKQKGDLGLIQTDALVNPGDSGGPVLDNDGRVIGIVESGVQGAGLNFATPVAKVKKMLQGPLVFISPIYIDYNHRTKPQTFSVSINSLSHDPPDYDLQLTITDPKGNAHTVSGKTVGGKCNLTLTPTADPTPVKWDPFAGDEPPQFKFTLTLKNSQTIAATEQGTIFIMNPQIAGINPGPTRSRGIRGTPNDPLPNDAQETDLIGNDKANPMRQVSPTEQLAVGVVYSTGQSGGKSVIENVRLLFAQPSGAAGQTITAQDGYVVGGLVVDSGVFINGFKVIFIRNKNGKLDPSDTYTSDWAGGSTSGKTKQLAGNGERVIGLCGRKGVYMRAVGLVLQKTTDSPATQPAH